MLNRLREFLRRANLDQLGVALLALAVLVLTVLRMFSRNRARRLEENNRFLNLWYRCRGAVTGWIDRRRQSRDYRFFTCPGCKNRLRVPRGKGHIQITCPKCGQRFDGRT